MKWIDTSDLELWASKPASKADLPLLVSRLIRATTTKIAALSMPKGKSINRGGWDGIVMASEGTEFVPAGRSFWEFGTTANAKGKADDDYSKRTPDPSATFIFVTPQAWEGGAEWAAEKTNEGKWKEVKVYNGSKLEEWLSTAPLQSYWLAKEIGRAPNEGVESAEDFWDNWKTGSDYILQPQVITIGREKEMADFTAAIRGNPSVVSIQASSRDEAIAFAIGSILQLDTEIQETILAKCVVVENDGSFKTLVSNNEQLILIAKLESTNAINRAVAKGHFVILPLGPDDNFPGNGNGIMLSRLHRDGFVEALVQSGVDRAKAQSLSKESSRNITIMRRLEKFDFDKPEWANGAHIRDIIPALLVGKWDESKEHDKAIVGAISNEPYDVYIAKLAKWKHTQDTPIYQIGSKWRISSPLDVWAHIAKYLTAADLDRFKAAFQQAVAYVKPMLELEPEKRIMASFYGKESEYSGWVREGLVQSLILIAVYGDEFKIVTPQDGQAFADVIVYKLLNGADVNLWCSINDIMPLIAEASPSSFLSGVEVALQGENPVIGGVFNEVDNGISPTSYHTGLLWALENLAWMPDALSRVTLIFGHLVTIDPGGRLSNRPANSLTDTFLPWHPQTYATHEQRMQVLQTLAGKFPDVAWNLVLSLLPKHHGGHTTGNHKCRWRKFAYSEPVTTYPELFTAYSDLLTLCLSMVGHNVDRIVKLIDVSDVSRIDTTRILGYIKDNADLIDDRDHKIWAELRKTIGHHRSFPTANWALPEETLAPYIELHEIFMPTSQVELYKWLFQDNWPTFPEGSEQYTDKRQEELLQRRIAALQAIEKEVGINGIVDLLPELIPHITGETLGHLIDTEERLYEIFALLNNDDKGKQETLRAVLFHVYWLKGFSWVQNLYEKVAAETSESDTLANIVTGLPQLKEVWDFIDTTTQPVQDLYWNNVNLWLGEVDKDYMEKALLKSIAVQKFAPAIEQMSFHVNDISTETIYTVLAAAATTPSEDMRYLKLYTLTRIFEELDKRGDLDEKNMTQLELYYLTFLTAYGSNRKPKMLHKEIASNPASFIELLQWVYLPNTDEQREAEKERNERNQKLAEAGYHLLDSWETIPGTADDGTIDYAFLEEWVKSVRDQAEAVGRIEVADMEIAKILACYKSTDGVWPSDEICKIIDGINTKSIRSNFHAAIYNNRGTTTRGVFDGGDQERELSVYFRTLAQKHAIKWPVTSAILDSLAKEYEVMGKEEDRQASEIDLDY